VSLCHNKRSQPGGTIAAGLRRWSSGFSLRSCGRNEAVAISNVDLFDVGRFTHNRWYRPGAPGLKHRLMARTPPGCCQAESSMKNWLKCCLRIWILCAGLVTIGLFAAEPAAERPVLKIVTDKAERPIAFEATGLSASDLEIIAAREDSAEAFGRVLSVSVVDENAAGDVPAMAGTYSVDGTSLRFTPRFALRPGLRYRALLQPDSVSQRHDQPKAAGSAKPVTLEVTVPEAAAGKPTEITHVYPTTATLPENQLKFYIHFSAPMGRGEAYEHVRLLDAKGRTIDLPFLELAEELWDATGRRMTLFIDPGRIKRGLKPREDLGPVLEVGNEYTLVIDRKWRDAAGRPLKADFQKKFRVAAPEETAIDETAWRVTSPRAGSSDPLVVKFPRPLDHALVERTLTVRLADGTAVAGRGTTADEERRWEFRPESPWQFGKHRIVIDTTLEDLAGNRIGRPFDFDKLGAADVRPTGETVTIAFEVTPQSR
jgi:hypothetical protein